MYSAYNTGPPRHHVVLRPLGNSIRVSTMMVLLELSHTQHAIRSRIRIIDASMNWMTPWRNDENLTGASATRPADAGTVLPLCSAPYQDSRGLAVGSA